MQEKIEIEYKILLSENIFHKILNDYQQYINNHYIQINEYFTHPLLLKKKYMLRIRIKNNHYEMTLKRPTNNHHLETNVSLSFQEYQTFLNHQSLTNDIIEILKQEGINPLELQQEFSLTTHRYDILLPEGVLSLDENSYLNQKDYELEFEVDDETIGYQKFLKIIEPYHLSYTKNAPSKIKRVLDAL